MTRPATLHGFALNLLFGIWLHLVPLPDAISMFRPLFLPMLFAYWALRQPQLPLLISAWFTGLCLDALFGAVLGQHALALVIATFLTLRLRGLLLMFPPWQAAGVLVPVWAIYTFLLFWVDGATQHAADPWHRWLPLVVTAPLWPLLAQAMDQLRARPAEAQ